VSKRSRRRRPTRPPRRTPAAVEVASATISPIGPGLAARRVAVRNPPARGATRAQLMLAVRIFAVFGCLLLGLPALFATHPGLADYRIIGLPLPWVLLGGAVYPMLVLLGVLYVRQAERNERDFVEFIERS